MFCFSGGFRDGNAEFVLEGQKISFVLTKSGLKKNHFL